MNQAKKPSVVEGTMQPEYDFSGAVRGKYFRRYRESSNDPGFRIWADVLAADEVVKLLAGLEGIPHRSRAGARHLLANAQVAAVAADRRLVDIARTVLGAHARPFRATLFDKSPYSNWLVVWHQDTALPLRARRDLPGWGPWSVKGGLLYAHAPAAALERVVALRLHLDDSTATNGPLRVLPGTHTLGALGDQAIQDLAHRVPARDCLVGSGGVVSMRPLLVHASSKSESAAPRRVLHFEYATSFVLEQGLELAVA